MLTITFTTVLVLLNTFQTVISVGAIFNSQLYEDVIDEKLCVQQILQMNTLQFKDASAKIPQSVLRGSQGDLGNYRQCLQITQDLNSSVVEGKYCMMKITFTYPNTLKQLSLETSRSSLERLTKQTLSLKTLLEHVAVTLLNNNDEVLSNRALQGIPFQLSTKLGICVPKSCKSDYVFGLLLDNLNVPIEYKELFCRLPNDKFYAPVDYVAFALCTIVVMLIVLSTSYDVWHIFYAKSDPKSISKFYRCGSIYTNTKRLLTFKSSDGSIDCLDGVRSLSIIWVICGHCFVSILTSIMINPLDIFESLDSTIYTFLMAGVMAVDTFFMMSGMLVVYTTAAKLSQIRLLKNIHMFYLHRLLRMFPLLAAAVLFQASIFHHVWDGPNWHSAASFIIHCREYWWATFLHIQNYYNPKTMCLNHSWYLSVDTQLHILSPIILFWVLGRKLFAWCGLTIGILVSIITATLYCFLSDFNQSDFLHGTNVINYFTNYYVNTLTRSPPFCVGMIFGYLLHTYRGKTLRLPKIVVVVGWLLSFTTIGLVIYANSPTLRMSPTMSDFINAYMRAIWSLAVAWIVFACVKGYGGPVNWFLSLNIWKFIGRISYSLYLFHFPLQLAIQSSSHTAVYYTIAGLLTQMARDLLLSTIFATTMCIVIDAPFSTIQKLLFEQKVSRKPVKNMEENIIIPQDTPRCLKNDISKIS